MEEDQRPPGGRRDRARPAKAAFTPPEQQADTKPAPPDADPAPAAARRPAPRKPAPSVLFQPPTGPDEAPAEPRPAARRRPEPPPEPEPTPAPEQQATPAPEQQPTSAPARRARPAKATPAAASTPPKAASTPRKAASSPTKAASPSKAASAPKKAPAATATPAKKATKTAAPAAPVTETAPSPEPSPARSTPRLLDHPGHAPELLALAAVRTLGPRARAWAAQTRATYPTATPDGLARLATRRFVRLAGAGGAVSAASGFFTPITELATLAWVQAALVLHLAAAYEQDPTDPDRAVDVLVLSRVYPSPETARAALAAAVDPAAGDEGQPVQRTVEALWRLTAPLAGQASGWQALRLVARALPGARLLTAGAAGAATAERLARRATAHYRAGAAVTAS